MKKIILLLVVIVSFAVTSCSKDSENASLQGKWEYLKQGTVTNGQEVLTDYVAQTGCSKNYSMITSTTIMDHTFSGNTCFEDISNQPYTRVGNTLKVTGESNLYTFEIKTLDSTTLKIYLTYIDSQPSSQVFVFKRVN